MYTFPTQSTLEEKRELLDKIALAYVSQDAWKEIQDIFGKQVDSYVELWKLQQALRLPGMRLEGR